MYAQMQTDLKPMSVPYITSLFTSYLRSAVVATKKRDKMPCLRTLAAIYRQTRCDSKVYGIATVLAHKHGVAVIFLFPFGCKLK